MKSANTVFGKSSGKLAGVVASTWKGINVVREKPLNVSQPNTIPQLNQRARMKLAIQLQKPNLTYIRVAFHQVAIRKTEYNCALQQIMKCITATGGVATLGTIQAGCLAKGSLTGVSITAAYVNDIDSIVIQWTDNSNGTTVLGSDVIHAAAVGDDGAIQYSEGVDQRDNESAYFPFTGNKVVAGSTVFLWVSREVEGKVSDSSVGFVVTP